MFTFLPLSANEIAILDQARDEIFQIVDVFVDEHLPKSTITLLQHVNSLGYFDGNWK